jgi:hypothetical protein
MPVKRQVTLAARPIGEPVESDFALVESPVPEPGDGEVLDPALDDPSLLEPLSPGAMEIAASAVYAAASEWARNAEDVVRRRTTLAHRGCAAPSVISEVEELIGARKHPTLAVRG